MNAEVSRIAPPTPTRYSARGRDTRAATIFRMPRAPSPLRPPTASRRGGSAGQATSPGGGSVNVISGGGISVEENWGGVSSGGAVSTATGGAASSEDGEGSGVPERAGSPGTRLMALQREQ